MIRILKQCCIYSALIFFGVVLINATLKRFVKTTPKKVYIAPKIEKKEYRDTKLYEHLKPKTVDPQKTFYNTIIENNIFAPLGYKPPQKTPTYRLLGTKIPVDKITETTAMLQETVGEKKIHFVTIGTKIGQDMMVMDIQPKQIIIKKDNRQIRIKLNTRILLR